MILSATASAQITEIIDTTGDGAGNPLDETRSIAVTDAGDAYVTGRESDNALRIDVAPGPTIFADAFECGLLDSWLISNP